MTTAAEENADAVAICLHEAAHAVSARMQRLSVKEAIATKADSGVTTRWRWPSTTQGQIDTLECLAITDLAGPAAEKFYLDQAGRDLEWRLDEQAASSRAAAIVRLRHGGLAEDTQLTTAQRAEVDVVLCDLRSRAELLVQTSPGPISRVAAALVAGKPLAQNQIDDLIADSPG